MFLHATANNEFWRTSPHPGALGPDSEKGRVSPALASLRFHLLGFRFRLVLSDFGDEFLTTLVVHVVSFLVVATRVCYTL